ncbi:MAG: SCO family protein [Bacteroidota bacterium]|nr:SCO family protein [Bacteroidota bacterium]MDP3143898.1 SCO family protein [Bacteroidota bacterium]
MKGKINYYWLLILIPVIFVGWYLLRVKEDKPITYLAYFGPKQALKINDTTYHFIPDFEFTSQFNQKVTQADLKDKIYVTEYFFTTCQSICPVMNTNLERVYAEFKDNPEFLIVSHTVDPEMDSVPVLLEYAKKHDVVSNKWLFLTGEKAKLYDIARKGYLLNAEEGTGDADDFIHTQNFALIDKEKHIRGFYDGTDSLEINRLINEIKLLIKEYDYKKRISN